MVESIDIAIVTIIISAIGITGGFVYNAHSVKQNTKTRYYQIIKDLQDRFREIDKISNDQVTDYKTEIGNFAYFMILLIERKILPQEYIIPEFSYIFKNSLWIINRASERVKKDLNGVIDFCEKNNIQEEKPPRQI